MGGLNLHEIVDYPFVSGERAVRADQTAHIKGKPGAVELVIVTRQVIFNLCEKYFVNPTVTKERQKTTQTQMRSLVRCVWCACHLSTCHFSRHSSVRNAHRGCPQASHCCTPLATKAPQALINVLATMIVVAVKAVARIQNKPPKCHKCQIYVVHEGG